MQRFYRPQGHKGIGVVWAMIGMVALCGIASFAVDYGRVRLAKSQLQAAADSAALAAANALPSGFATARAEAVKYVSNNTADGKPIPIDANADIVFGYWGDPTNLGDDDGTIFVDPTDGIDDPDPTSQFTPLAYGDPRANAVRVSLQRSSARGNALPLNFAALLGAKTCDVHADATAVSYNPGSGDGFIGIKKIKLGHLNVADSYVASAGTYSVSRRRQNAAIKTNGKIKLETNTTVYGDARPGANRGPAVGGTVTGSRQPLTHMLSYPPVDNLPARTAAKPASKGGDLEVKKGQTVALAAGTYRFHDVKLDDNCTLRLDGPVTLYVDHSLEVKGTIVTYLNKPGNLTIYGDAKGSIKLGSATLYANLYAPQSKAEIKDDGVMFGSLIAIEFKTGDRVKLHWEESLVERQINAALVN